MPVGTLEASEQVRVQLMRAGLLVAQQPNN
jgi:hypothetical protein